MAFMTFWSTTWRVLLSHTFGKDTLLWNTICKSLHVHQKLFNLKEISKHLDRMVEAGQMVWRAYGYVTATTARQSKRGADVQFAQLTR